jgi:hypothetical protein
MKLGRPVAGAALLLAILGGATAGALLLGTAGAAPGVPVEVSTTAAAGPERCGPALAAVVDVIGVPAGELRRELAQGATLAGIAEAGGVDPQAVVDAAVAASSARIDAAVAAGRLTEVQATRRRETLPARVAEIVAAPAADTRDRAGGGRADGRRDALVRAADAIGVPPTELRTALAGGSTLADVAEARGVDPAVVVDALLARARERTTALVEGDGRRGGTTAC